MPVTSRSTLIRVADLSITFHSPRGVGSAVDGVSFEIRQGETLGLVGESGCGKSVTALAIVGLLRGADIRGSVWYQGSDLLTKSETEMRDFRGRHISMVLQDPLTALNPVFTIGDQVGEAVRIHSDLRGDGLRQRTIELLDEMRIPHPAERLSSYPHQFSGGMRQRAVGAISLAGNPEVLIADEPTTALDVTIQAAYLDLLKDIQAKMGLGILFITHDFGVVGEMCDRVAVMYAGRIAEVAPTRKIMQDPRHPYTKALLYSVPDLRQGTRRLTSIDGSPPSIFAQPPGCRFHTRCWLYEAKGRPERCRTDVPDLTAIDASQKSACHFQDEVPDATPH